MSHAHEKAMGILQRHSAVIANTHVVYTSGAHGSAYVNKDAVYPNTADVSRLCALIAERFRSHDIQVVVGPEKGGIILSQWVAHHLSKKTGREVLAVYAEKSADGESFVIKRGQDKLLSGRRVLIVEDVLTTGGSVRKVVEAVRNCAGHVVGVGAICNRGGVMADDLGHVPRLYALVNITLDTYEADSCPLCQTKVPINTDVGKGCEFLARRAANS